MASRRTVAERKLAGPTREIDERHYEARCVEGRCSDGRNGCNKNRRRGGAGLERSPSRPGRSNQSAALEAVRRAKFENFAANTKKFGEQTGVEVRLDADSRDGIRPKASIAANVGAGPDIIMGTNDDPFKFPEKLLDMTDLAEYLAANTAAGIPYAQIRHASRPADSICRRAARSALSTTVSAPCTPPASRSFPRTPLGS